MYAMYAAAYNNSRLIVWRAGVNSRAVGCCAVASFCMPTSRRRASVQYGFGFGDSRECARADYLLDPLVWFAGSGSAARLPLVELRRSRSFRLTYNVASLVNRLLVPLATLRRFGAPGTPTAATLYTKTFI